VSSTGTRFFVVAVTVALDEAHGIDRSDVASAFIAVDSVATARVSADGTSVVYRADIAARTPEEAVEPALEPARRVASRLGITHRPLGAQVEEEDPHATLPTGRRVVLRATRLDAQRSTTTSPSSTDTG
jgi:hypothetical protein